MRPVRPFATVASIPECLVVATFLAAAAGAGAQGTEPGIAPPVSSVREPGLSLTEAELVGAAAGLALGAALAHGPEGPPALRPLRSADAILTGSAAALYLSAALFDRPRSAGDPASPATPAAPTSEINGFDRKIRTLAVGHRSLENRLLLDHLSSTTLMVVLFQSWLDPFVILVAVPGALAGVAWGLAATGSTLNVESLMGAIMSVATDVPHKWSRDVPVIAEATAFTLSVNAFVKHLARRSRPAAHFCESEHAVAPCPPDTRLSFYSGHTSGAFAAAVAAGTIADFHRFPNRKWIWASGLTFATATGVLRVMSDQHYATDVLTGMAAGGLAGWLIPKIHKPDATAPPSGTAAPAGPTAVVAVPVALLAGRSGALVSVGSVGGGPYFGVHWRW